MWEGATTILSILATITTTVIAPVPTAIITIIPVTTHAATALAPSIAAGERNRTVRTLLLGMEGWVGGECISNCLRGGIFLHKVRQGVLGATETCRRITRTPAERRVPLLTICASTQAT